MRLLRAVSNPRLRLWAVALMVGTLTLDAGVLEINYLVPATVRPSDSNFVNNPESNGEVLVRLSEERGKPCDIIFIGASNIQYWTTEGRPVWDKYYVPRNAFNFGVAGDTTENVLWRFDHMNLQSLKPKVAVVFIGINNYTATPHELALGVRAITRKTQAVFPGIRVLMISITPDQLDNHRIELANKLIKTYADNKEVFYVDIYSKILQKGPDWEGVNPDHHHLKVKGYELWAQTMEPWVQALLPLTPEPQPVVVR